MDLQTAKLLRVISFYCYKIIAVGLNYLLEFKLNGNLLSIEHCYEIGRHWH